MTDPKPTAKDLDQQVEALHAFVEGLDELSDEGERRLRSLDRSTAERSDGSQNILSSLESDLQQS